MITLASSSLNSSGSVFATSLDCVFDAALDCDAPVENAGALETAGAPLESFGGVECAALALRPFAD